MVTFENCKEDVPETPLWLQYCYTLYVNTQAEEGIFKGAFPESIEQEGNTFNSVYEPIQTVMVLDEVAIGSKHVDLTDFGSPRSVEPNLQALQERTEVGDLEWIALIKESRALNGTREGDVEVEWIRLIKHERELRHRLTTIGVLNG